MRKFDWVFILTILLIVVLLISRTQYHSYQLYSSKNCTHVEKNNILACKNVKYIQNMVAIVSKKMSIMFKYNNNH